MIRNRQSGDTKSTLSNRENCSTLVCPPESLPSTLPDWARSACPFFEPPVHHREGQLLLAIARMKPIAIVGLSLLTLTSCIDSTGSRDDRERISGLYTLRSVDGVAIPAPIAPQQGCNRTVRDGIFTISVGGSDSRPMYDWSIAIPTDCQPVPPGVDQGDDDVGNWQFHQSSQLSFSSMMGRGSYGAALEETPGNPPAVTIAYAGNSYRFVRLMRFDDPQGVVYVDFVDQAGQRVAGVRLIFTFANGLQGGGTTPDSENSALEALLGSAKSALRRPRAMWCPLRSQIPSRCQLSKVPPLRVHVSLTKI